VPHQHYGQGHYYCQNDNRVFDRRHGQCLGCSTGIADLMLFDAAFDGGMVNDGLSFDPFDGQVAVGIPGTDLAFEPGTGDLDVETPFGDIPIGNGW
jgi:hypothetical protein